jgi:RHS repeat-associated protein
MPYEVSELGQAWDTSYKGVWHLSDNAATTSVSDSTAANNGSNQANTSSKSAAGQISKSLSYNGSSDYTDLGTNVGNYVLSDSFTLEAWVNPSLDSANRAVFGNAFAAAGYLFRITTGNKLRFILISDGNNYNGRDSSTLSSGWHHMVGVWSGSGNPNVYIDGVLDNAATVSGGTMSTITTAAHTRIGSTPESGSGYECYFNGSIDEVRSSKTARSADWIKTEYNNQKSTSTFYSVSAASGAAANPQWLVTDQLGTPRMVFDKTGVLANVKRHDYLPFGEELFAGGRTTTMGYSAADGVRQKFTQKERDSETGLDYFKARFYSSSQGRFTSPDAPFADQRQTDPSSWNSYAYVRNNPCNRTDPNGKCSPPPGLKPGQVGICIEAFIATKTFKLIGAGNGRTFNGNDETLTSKFRVDIIGERTPGNSKNFNITQKTRAGLTYTVDPVSGVQNLPAAQGSANSRLNSMQGGTSSPSMSASDSAGSTSITVPLDRNGNANFNVSTTAVNGYANLVPVDLGTIRSSFNLSINSNNGIGTLLEGSKASGYPSFAIYTYVEGKNIVTTPIKEIPEGEPAALKEPMKPVH